MLTFRQAGSAPRDHTGHSAMADRTRRPQERRRESLLVLLAIAGVLVLRWWSYLFADRALGDEGIYLRAFDAAAQGLDPYAIGGFYYPRTFALAGGWLLEAVGESATRLVLRTLSVAGLAVTVWIAGGLWPGSWRRRLFASAVYVCVAPAVYFGIETGNISFAVIGAILLALALWPRRPFGAGLLLGGSVAIKPLAPLAIVALVAHRPIPSNRRHLAAGFTAALVAGILLVSNPAYLQTPADAVHRLPFIRSISLNRILTLLGIEASPLALAAAVGVAVVIVAVLVPMRHPTLLCFAGLAAVLAVPIIWSHTLLLTLPLQVLALRRAAERRRDGSPATAGPSGSGRRVWLRYEWFFVALAVVAIQSIRGAGAVDDQPLAFQLVVLTGAYLAAPALMAYVLATEKPGDSDPQGASSARLSRQPRR